MGTSVVLTDATHSQDYFGEDAMLDKEAVSLGTAVALSYVNVRSSSPECTFWPSTLKIL